MSEEKPQKKTTMIVIVLSIFFVVIISCVIVFLVNFLNPKTVYRSSGSEDIDITSLYCKTTDLEKYFFKDDRALATLHEIKVTFNNGVADKISYTYTATYGNAEMVEKAHSNLAYNYNVYMGGRDIEYGLLHENYAELGDSLRINLVGDKDNLNSNTGVMFFLDTNSVRQFNKLKDVDLQTAYQNIGFDCKIND